MQAEVTLALGLFSDAARIDLRALRDGYALPARLLAIGLPLTIVAGTAAALIVLPELSLAEAAALAIVLAATDAASGARSRGAWLGGAGGHWFLLLERVIDGPPDGDHRHGRERPHDAEELASDDDRGERDDRVQLDRLLVDERCDEHAVELLGDEDHGGHRDSGAGADGGERDNTMTVPGTQAPRIGMDSVTKLSSASVPTCGVPITSMPRVITAVSISAMSVMPRIQPLAAFQAALPVTPPRARRPALKRSRIQPQIASRPVSR